MFACMRLWARRTLRLTGMRGTTSWTAACGRQGHYSAAWLQCDAVLHHVYTHTNTHTLIHTHVRARAHSTCTQTHRHTRTHAHTHLCTHTQPQTHSPTPTHTHTHICGVRQWAGRDYRGHKSRARPYSKHTCRGVRRREGLPHAVRCSATVPTHATSATQFAAAQ
jgi:hypothetical protein